MLTYREHAPTELEACWQADADHLLLAPLAAYSSQVQQLLRAMGTLGKHPHTCASLHRLTTSRTVPVATDLKAGSSDPSERLAMVPPGQPMSSSRAYWSVVASQNSTTLPSCRWKTCASLTVMLRPPRLAVAATSATPCSSSAKTE